jgi:hypothetical protein
VATSNIKRWYCLATAILLAHAALSFAAPNCYAMHVVGDVLQSLLLLCCYLFTLPNQVGRTRSTAFWTLVSVGFALWLLNQVLWTFFEVVLEKAPTPGFWGDVVLFLHPVPIIMALAAGPRLTRVATIVAASVFIFWTYLYTAFVVTWQYVAFDEGLYARNFNYVYGAANLALVAIAAGRSWTSEGQWRKVHLHLLGAASVYAMASYLASSAIDRGVYYTGSWYDIPLVAAILWFGLANLTGVTAVHSPIQSKAEPSCFQWLPIGTLLVVITIGIATLLTPDVPAFIVHFRVLLSATVFLGLFVTTLMLWMFGDKPVQHLSRLYPSREAR